MVKRKGHKEKIFFYHNDHRGAPKFMTDADQSIVWRADFDPFGNLVHGIPEHRGHGHKDQKGKEHISRHKMVKNNLRFPGQYFDTETGLNYNYFRYYDPRTGRYTQSDPIGLMGGMNPYRYARNNPLGRIDPFGLEDDECSYDSSSCDSGGYDSGSSDFSSYDHDSGAYGFGPYNLGTLTYSNFVGSLTGQPGRQDFRN